MTTDSQEQQGLPTDVNGAEIESPVQGRQIVRDLELFLDAELAHPSRCRLIPVRLTGSNQTPGATQMPFRGTNPW